MSTESLERVLFRVLPTVVLLAALIGIAVLAGTPWPWHRVVHEDGTRTLLDTVFFFEHATRELPPDIILALSVAGAVRYFFPPRSSSTSAPVARLRIMLALIVGLTLVVILGGTFRAGGGQAIRDNLSQLHTRSGAPLVWGAHWRYHLVERWALVLLAFGITGLLWLVRGRPDPAAAPGRFRLYGIALAGFMVMTLMFHPTSEPFDDPRFLGHQARELFTHTLVTLPLALGVCFEMARRFAPDRGVASTWRPWPIALAGGLGLLSGVYLLVASVLTGAQAQGQSATLGGLLFPHFAEHSLGYLLVPSLAGLLYLAPGPTWSGQAGDGTAPRTVRTQ